jgi:hypothetical protein
MSAAEVYMPGKKFRVIKEGARLTGWERKHGYFKGWARDLEVGEVVESLGYGPGIGSDPGYGIHFKVPDMSFVEFSPSQGGVFNYHPLDGYLEPVN